MKILPHPGTGLFLPKEKSSPIKRIGELSMLLYGLEKIGKTSLSAMFPDAFFLMCEPGAKGLSILKREVRDWKEFVRYLELLEADPDYAKTIVVDTADRCYKMCEEYMLKKMAIQHQSDEEFGKGWTLVKDEFARQIDKLLKLGRGVIFTSHAADKEIRTRTGNKYNRIMPTMSKQAREVLEPIVDLWAYMEYNDEEGRVLHLRGNSQIAAGHRLQTNFVGIDTVPMGKNASEAFENFMAAFHTTDAAPEKAGNNNEKKKLTIRRQ